LHITDTAKDELGSIWFDPTFGARPLKRAIQKYILDPLAMDVIRWKIHEWSTVTIDYKEDTFVII
jgi:ATP-dependent Clp protease ATP-binding subunit ClpB